MILDLKGGLGMTKKRFTVGELIKELEKLPKDYAVDVSVTYDNCEHIQPLNKIAYYEGRFIDWVTLRGGKND